MAEDTDYLRAAKRRRVSAQNFAAFASLIKTPGSLAVGIVMPANARLGASTSIDTSLGTLLITIGDRDIGVLGGPAGMIFRLQYASKDQVILPVATAPGNVKLYVLDEWQRPFLIGE